MGNASGIPRTAVETSAVSHVSRPHSPYIGAVTPTASRLKARLDERQRWFANEWFFKWHFIRNDGPVTIDSFDGRGIHQGGFKFAGGARDLYWETLVRGVKKEITEQFAWMDKEVRNYNHGTALRAIDECAGQLVSFVRVIRRRGVAKDRILRGDGREFPPENDAGRWEDVSDAEIVKQARALKEALPAPLNAKPPTPPNRQLVQGARSFWASGVAMADWTDEDLYRLDAELAKKGVARHARSFHAAMEILGHEFAIGVGGNPQVDEIIADYHRLFPDADHSWPGKGIGLAASVDQVRKVTVPVVFGTCQVVVSKGLGFETHEEFSKWCRYDSDIALKAAFAFADVFDLAYGRDEVSNASPKALETWTLALSQLEMTTNALMGGFDLSALTQSICMTVELSLKAALMHLGVDEKRLKALGHKNAESAEALAALKPHRDDALIVALVGRLPSYVGSRYKRADLTRLEMVDLALTSQFIASSTLRRLTSRDLAANIEQEEGEQARRRLYCWTDRPDGCSHV